MKNSDEFSEKMSEILSKKDEIIDLFCKTFILSREPKSPEHLRYLFSIAKLEVQTVSPNVELFKCSWLEEDKFEHKKPGFHMRIVLDENA